MLNNKSIFSALAICLAATSLTACGDTAEKAVKAAAKAVLEEDAKKQMNSTEEMPSNSAQGTSLEELEPQPVQVAKKAPTPVFNYRETPVNYYAEGVSRTGSNIIIRSQPNRSAARRSHLEFGEGVTVIAETNRCETINGLYNCWLKVRDGYGTVGYVFGGYLNR